MMPARVSSSRSSLIRLCLAVATLPGLIAAAALAQPVDATMPKASGFRLQSTWKPGGEGNCGFLNFDSASHRLYAARTSCVQIINPETGVLVRSIPGLENGQSIALAPEFSLGFATSGDTDSVLTFNLTSLRVQGAAIKVGQKPGAIVYEPLNRQIFVFNRASHTATVIDPAKYAVVATIPLGGVPAGAASDGSGAVFVDLEDKDEVVTIDAQSNKVSHHWPIAPGSGSAMLVADPVKHRLLVGCRNGKMIVLDARSGKRLSELSIGSRLDACAFDPASGVAFASGAEGTLAVLQEDAAKPGEFQVVEAVKTKDAVGAMTVDPISHAVYLATRTSSDANDSAASEKAQPPNASTSEGFALLKFTK